MEKVEKRISELADRTKEIIRKAATKGKKQKVRNRTDSLSTEKKMESFNSN